ncbi:MAG: SDR family oxidoreductase [Rhodospirillaceae bacterium]
MSGVILVVGATGNTGRALVRKLVKKGVAVRAVARGRVGLRSLQVTDFVEIDYSNPSSLDRAFREVEKVYLALPLVAEMVTLTEMVVGAAKKAGVRHLVKLSGLAAGQPGRLQLGRWHRDAERVVEASGMAWTHLRPNSFMQNFINHSLGSMKGRGLFHCPVGNGRVSYINVEDIAATAATVLTGTGHEGAVYTLTGPQAISSYDVAETFSKHVGRTIRCVEISVDAARDAMFGFGLPVPVVDAVAELFRSMRDGELDMVTSGVEQLTGFSAQSFAQFAEEHVRLFR